MLFFALSSAALIRALIWPGELELLRDEERSILPDRDMQRGLMTSFLWMAGFPWPLLYLAWLGALAFVSLILWRLCDLATWVRILLALGAMVLLTLLADLTNPALPLGALGRILPDMPWLDPLIDYLKNPQLIGIPR